MDPKIKELVSKHWRHAEWRDSPIGLVLHKPPVKFILQEHEDDAGVKLYSTRVEIEGPEAHIGVIVYITAQGDPIEVVDNAVNKLLAWNSRLCGACSRMHQALCPNLYRPKEE